MLFLVNERLTNSFRNCHVKFTKRQTNEVVHVLAKMVPSFARLCIFTDIPTCIQNFIINDIK